MIELCSSSSGVHSPPKVVGELFCLALGGSTLPTEPTLSLFFVPCTQTHRQTQREHKTMGMGPTIMLPMPLLWSPSHNNAQNEGSAPQEAEPGCQTPTCFLCFSYPPPSRGDIISPSPPCHQHWSKQLSSRSSNQPPITRYACQSELILPSATSLGVFATAQSIFEMF